MAMNGNRVLYLRNFIFGAEDSFVSTVGLLSGIAVGGASRADIILTGVVLIFVEAFSMGVGSFLSEYSADESTEGANFNADKTIRAGLVMFLSYLLCGLVPLWPYLLFKNGLWLSILSSLLGLLVLGYYSGKMLKIRIWKSTMRMTFIGGFAIALGMFVGKIIGG